MRTDAGAVVRRHGHFDAAEDAVQEALLAVATQSPAQGVVHGPAAALGLLAALETDDRMAGHHRLAAVRAHCHELGGDHDAAAAAYRAAARTATSLSERRYLEARAARLAGTGGPARAAGTAGSP